MKLVFCLECGDIFSPGKSKPKTCECGYSLGKWRDPSAGTLEVASRYGADVSGALMVVGINNGYFALARDCKTNKDWREKTQELLEASTGYLFHAEARNSPMVLINVGESNDVFWNQELLKEVEWHGKWGTKGSHNPF
jgi:hypothetical protein